MTEIDFYLLQNPSQNARQDFALKLVHKIHQLKHKIIILAKNEENAHAFSSALWNFQHASFLANEIHVPITGEASEGQQPDPQLERRSSIQICHQNETQLAPNGHHEVLINLSTERPQFFSRFNRVVEIVSEEPEIKEIMRQNYSFYKERGYALKMHKLTK